MRRTFRYSELMRYFGITRSTITYHLKQGNIVQTTVNGKSVYTLLDHLYNKWTSLDKQTGIIRFIPGDRPVK